MFMADLTYTGEGAGPTNLTVKWKFNTGAEVISPSTIVNGVCYVGSTNDNIYALDADKGTQLWSFKTGYELDPKWLWSTAKSTRAQTMATSTA